MKGNVARWCIAAVMLLFLCVVLSSPGIAEIEPIPLDLKVKGRPLQADGCPTWNTRMSPSTR